MNISHNRLALVALLCTVLLWAVAANFANSLFLVGVNPLELAGASATIATFGFAILHSFLGQPHAKAMSWQQFTLGLILVLLVGADYLAIQRLPVAVAIVLLFTSPILVVLWTAILSRRVPSRSVIIALVLAIIGVVLVSNVLASNLNQVNWTSILIGLSTAIFFVVAVTSLQFHQASTSSGVTHLPP